LISFTVHESKGLCLREQPPPELKGLSDTFDEEIPVDLLVQLRQATNSNL
jgi:hypothetical protein